MEATQVTKTCFKSFISLTTQLYTTIKLYRARLFVLLESYLSKAIFIFARLNFSQKRYLIFVFDYFPPLSVIYATNFPLPPLGGHNRR
jgi:hypothetical protein